MAIAISVGVTADIETYDGLQTFLVEHLELDEETQDQLPSLIRLAEYRLDRLLTVPQRESVATVTATSGKGALPSNCRSVRAVRLADGSPLVQVSADTLFTQYGYSGTPSVYAIIDQSVWVGPSATQTLSVLYTTSLPTLGDSNASNWLLDQNADAYVYAAIRECEVFRGNDERAALASQALDGIIAEINRQAMKYRAGGPLVMKARTVC